MITRSICPKLYPEKHLRFNRGALENEAEEVEEKTPHLSPLLPISSKQSPVHSSGYSFRDGISRRGSSANRNVQILL